VGTDVKDAISGTGETMPKGPPATRGARERLIIMVLPKKMAVVAAVNGTINRGRVSRAHREVNVNKVPPRPEGMSGPIGNEEEAVGTRGNSGEESGARGEGNREAEIVGSADGDGGSGGNGGNRDREGGWERGVIGDIAEGEKRGVVGGERRREPEVVIHLDFEGRLEGVGKWSEGVIEVS
jgi:hypothetical protein